MMRHANIAINGRKGVVSKRLAGKVGLITGGGGGIGAAIARAMIDEGATIFIGDINAPLAEATAAEIGAKPLSLDVTDPDSWVAAAGVIEQAHGRLDILVHNAGTEVVKPLHELSTAEIRRQIAVNLEGPMYGCAKMLPLLGVSGRDGPPAAVINIASVAGMAGQSDLSVYSAAKAAVGHLAQSLAIEWTNHGYRIRINAIFPGCIRTAMLEDAINGMVREGVLPAEDAWGSMSRLSPLNQIGDPSDIAMGAVYLASDEAKFITGTSLVIDGGWMAKSF